MFDKARAFAEHVNEPFFWKREYSKAALSKSNVVGL